MTMTVDILNEQNDMINHSHQVVLWPRKWQEYDSINLVCTWHMHQLVGIEKPNIPKQSGIYTLLVQPSIAAHPACSYLMYVGQTKSLRRRFSDYLTSEKRASGRPKIFRLLNLYENNLWFCYTLVPPDKLDVYEDALMASYMPPKNSDNRMPASVRSIRGAF